jgi:hypothetical protein
MGPTPAAPPALTSEPLTYPPFSLFTTALFLH